MSPKSSCARTLLIAALSAMTCCCAAVAQPSPPMCQFGQILFQGRCVQACSGGQVHVQPNGVCACPAGTALSKGVCAPVPSIGASGGGGCNTVATAQPNSGTIVHPPLLANPAPGCNF
jgi:hypothetical protein